MSTHPNAILLVAFTPDDLPLKTARAICADAGVEWEGESTDSVRVGEQKYHPLVMESNYDDDLQIGAKEGDIVFWDCVTYGYGETIAWEDLAKRRNTLEDWAKKVAAKHHCLWRIEVTANYW